MAFFLAMLLFSLAGIPPLAGFFAKFYVLWACTQAGYLWLVVIGVLNVGVSFLCAFKVALRSRGVRVQDRRRIRAALWQRLRTRPMSFLRPPPFG